MNQVATIEKSKATPAPMLAGGTVKPVVPQSMEDAYRMAVAVCKAGMAPQGLNTPEKAMIAILHGLEVGLTPMAALQRIAVVNGRPTIWGDGAIGLVRGSGLCEFIKERIDGSGDKMAAVCEAKRRGENESITRTFSVEDAKKAGLWGKAGTWQQYPKRMLQMRARAFALRDGFADVLGGLYLREELEDDRPMRDVTPTPPSPPSPPALEAPDETEDDPALLSAADSATLRDSLLAKLHECGSTEAIEVWDESVASQTPTMQPDDRLALMNERSARLADLYEREQGDDAIEE